MPTETNSHTTRNVLISIIVIALIGAAGWWYMQKGSYILPVASDDTVSSWDFQGTRKDGGPLEEGVQKEIQRLSDLLGGDQSGLGDDPTDYTLYVSIAAQYESLGEGAKAREYLEKALKIDSETTGLAWHNLGTLMARLGAKNTARIAFQKAVDAQPTAVNYQITRLNFLMNNFASDTVAVDDAFAGAHAALADDPSILQIEAQWYEMSNRTDKAIEALQKMKSVMPTDAQVTIDAEIKRLQNK